jgi:hypothetical protein
MVDVHDAVRRYEEVGKERGARRRDSVAQDGASDLGKSLRRLHRVSVDRWGGTVVVSHAFERVR